MGIMGWLRTVAGVAALAVQATVAMAADMPGTLPPPPADYPAPAYHPYFIDLNRGWYLRADFGANIGEIGDAEVGPGAIATRDNTLGNGYMGGIGAGVKSDWLRTDVTLDYSSPMEFQGTTFTTGDVSADVSVFSALFNGYLDLGTWYRMTPYLGAGAGVAGLHVSNYRSAVAPLVTGGSHDEWNFAWAVMGGVGFAISPNLLMDLGYRYIDFGDVTTDDSPGATLLKNISAHEIRIGMRWSFDDLPVGR
jgi:opacity protein-like surface antigen